MMGWWSVAAFAIEPGATEVFVERLTPEMHWFRATAIQVEALGCTVGVPVAGKGEPIVMCSFPSGLQKDDSLPKALGGAAERARDAVRDHLGDDEPVRGLKVTYLATEQRAFLCDHTLLPSGLWSTRRVTVGIKAGQAHVAAGEGVSGGGEGLFGCAGRPVALPVSAGGPVLDGLPAAVASLPPTPTEPQREDVIPSHVVWSASGAPIPGGSGFMAQIPADPKRIVGTRVTWMGLGADGVVHPVSIEMTSGLPDEWIGFDGGAVPADAQPRAILEVFATDVPPGHHWTPEAQGFERLSTSTLIPDPSGSPR